MRWVAVLVFCCWSVFSFADVSPIQLVQDARAQVGQTLGYDSAYRQIAYPNGDVPLTTGVCTDVVVRALRQQGVDLQRLVHEDMRENFARYPQNWGLRGPDRNIDHRRVPNLMRYFERRGWSLPASQQANSYQAGDIVAWDLGRGLLHIGVVSDRATRAGVPLIIHNIGSGTREENLLFSYRIIGHYRLADVLTQGPMRREASSGPAPQRRIEAAPVLRSNADGIGGALRAQRFD